MKIKVEIKGLDALTAKLGAQARQIPFAMSKALNATAKKVVEAMPAEIAKSIDRPTPFTQRGVRILSYANKSKLAVTVGFMDTQAKYMAYQIAGGVRQPKSAGIRLPGNVVLNAFGNIPKGLTKQLKDAALQGRLSKDISYKLQAFGNRRKKAAPIELFYGQPAGAKWAKAPVGIWRRIPGNPGKLVPVIIFANKPAQYKPRFDFQRKALVVVGAEWSRQFDAALADALRTAK